MVIVKHGSIIAVRIRANTKGQEGESSIYWRAVKTFLCL